MIHYSHYRSGSLYGMRYQFAAGDRLPLHAHTPELAHNVIVLAGLIEITVAGDTHRLRPGEVYDFSNEKPHEVVALDPSVTLHLFLQGTPPGYDTLPDSELSGVMP